MKKIVLLASALIFLAAGCSQTKQPAGQIITDTSRQQIQASLKVEGQFGDKLFNFYADENKTALDLLKTAYKVELKNSVIVSIAGTKPDSKHFWELFINGKASKEDPGTYKPVNGDKFEWKLSLINQSK